MGLLATKRLMLANTAVSQSNPIRVMIVEDHQIIAWGLKKLINEQQPHMSVWGVASSPDDAIVLTGQAPATIVLLKYEFALNRVGKMLLQTLGNRGCRTLLLLSNITKESLHMSLQSGAHGVLTPRSRPKEVVKAIEKTSCGELWFGREAVHLAVKAMRGTSPLPEGVDTPLGLLTRRERKVLDVLVANASRTNKEVAQKLFISESTLRNHLSSIYQKCGVANRIGLYVLAQGCASISSLDSSLSDLEILGRADSNRTVAGLNQAAESIRSVAHSEVTAVSMQK